MRTVVPNGTVTVPIPDTSPVSSHVPASNVTFPPSRPQVPDPPLAAPPPTRNVPSTEVTVPSLTNSVPPSPRVAPAAPVLTIDAPDRFVIRGTAVPCCLDV